VRPLLLELIRCPGCEGELALDDAVEAGGRVKSGVLACAPCGRSWPVRDFVPRFAPEDNYANSFGFQWGRFQRTQLDSQTGVPISRERFFVQSGWDPADLDGRRVLDAGCGAGRFAEVALACGATVVAVDYSTAVDACYQNLGHDSRFHAVQADITALPLAAGSFDYVYCFGVLQHTPDPGATLMALPPLLRPGGRLAVDVYMKTGLEPLWPKYWLRPLTKRIDKDRLFRAVSVLGPRLLPLSSLIGRTPRIGRRLRYLVPVVNYEGIHPLDATALREWSILDTFDMLSPSYDRPQSPETLSRWLAEAGMDEIEVLRTGHLVGRGVNPPATWPPR
jgi:SAM-dependent methyltransferase